MIRFCQFAHFLFAALVLTINASGQTEPEPLPKLRDRPVSIQLSGPVDSGLTLEPGRSLSDADERAPSSPRFLGDIFRSLALRTGDVNGDTVPDLIHLYQTDTAAAVELHLGRAEATFPFSLGVAQETGAHDEEGLPFSPPRTRIELSIRPAFFVVADVTLDGHLDLLFAPADSESLWCRKGDGEGGFAPAIVYPLPGRITLLETGDIDLADGLTDLLIGVEGTRKSLLLLEHGSHHSFLQQPEVVELDSAASTLAVGRLDGDHLTDIAVAFGNTWGLIRGTSSWMRGGTRTLDSTRKSTAQIGSLAIGNFVGGPDNDLVLLHPGGRLDAFERLGDQLVGTSSHSLELPAHDEIVRSGAWKIQRARVSSFEHDDLILSQSGVPGATIFAELDSDSNTGQWPASGWTSARVRLTTRTSVVDIVPLHLNRDARHDLIVLEDAGPNRLSIIQTQQAGSYVVNATSTESDGNPGDGKCAIEPCEDGNCTGPCTLRAAQLEAALRPGEETRITFNLPAGSTIEGINIGSRQPIVVDGNIDGAPGIIIDGAVPGAEGIDGVFLDASNSLITGLVIRGWVQSFSAGGRGVHIQGGTGNRIIGNYIGTDLTGNEPVDDAAISRKAEAIQVVGDMTTISRNVIGGHQGGIILNSNDNVITSNRVGVGKDGQTILFSSGGGIRVMGDNNRIGTSASDGNLISGNRGTGAFSGGIGIGVAGRGNRIQGNAIGLAADLTLLPNGVAIGDEGSGTLIGGAFGFLRNLIAEGVLLAGTGTVAMGNRLGTNLTGDEALGATAGFDITGSRQRIGGDFSDEGNIIAGGGFHGIRATAAFDVQILNNFIGTGRNGAPALGGALDAILVDSSQKILVRENTLANRSGLGATGISILGVSQVDLRENAIFNNAGLGIDWGGDGITENGTSEDVPNHPILESFEGGILTGQLDGGPGEFRIEVFGNSACDDSALDSEGRPHGEGSSHLQTISGVRSGPFALSVFAFVNGAVSATATGEEGRTSEFSNCIAAVSGPLFLVNSTVDRREPEGRRGDRVCDTGEMTEGGEAECTLRAALEESNTDMDLNGIRFLEGLGAITVPAGAPPLPPIIHSVDMRTSRREFQRLLGGTPAAGQARVGWGIRVEGEGSVIEGLEIRHFQTGISIAGQAEVKGNRLLENETGLHVRIGNSTAPAIVGGPSTSASCESPCNLISENTLRGIELENRPAVVQGNWIGLTENGTRAPGQEVGILARGAANQGDVLIGGPSQGEGNRIAADPEKGACIEIEGSNLIIQGNQIGVDSSGNRALGCGPHAITFEMVGVRPVQNNLIGGLDPGAGNRIASGTLDGIRFLAPSTPDSRLVRQLFLSNTFLGSGLLQAAINLNSDKGDLNDFLDADRGNNGLQNPPRITQVLQKPSNQFGPAATFISWEFFEAPDDDVTLQFFSQPDGSDGTGEELIASEQFETASSADVAGAPDQRARTTRQQVTILDLALASDESVTATATSALSGTSEFTLLPRFPSLDTDGDGVPDSEEPGKKEDPQRADLNLRRLVMALDSDTRARVTLLVELMDLDGHLFLGDLLGLNLGGEEGPGASPTGSTATFTVTLTLPDGLEADSYYNFGPEASDPTDHYYEFLFDGETGAEIEGNTITLHYIDGGRGDHDLMINGEIETLGGFVVFAEPLYFPFLRSTSSAFTGLAVSNYDEGDVHLEFNGFDRTGIPTGGLLNPSSFGLAGGEQLAILGSEVFQLSPTEEASGWVKVEVDQTEVGSFSQVGEGTSLDGSVALTETSEVLFFTRVFEGQGAYRGLDATTTLSVVNPNVDEVEVRLELIGAGGTATTRTSVAAATRIIAPRGQLLESVEEIFETTDASRGGLVRVVSVRAGGTTCDGQTTQPVCGLIGFELIEIPQPGTVIGLNAVVASEATELYSAQLASVDSAIFTSIKLVNIGSEIVRATLRALSETGEDLAEAVEMTLAPGEFREEDASDLFGFEVAAVGSLQVEADRSGLVGDVVFGAPSSGAFAAALPLQEELLTDAVFSQVANVEGFFTGLALFVPGPTPATITISVFRADGSLGGTTEFVLPGGERLSKSVVELLEETNGQAGGYIRIRSTQPLVAQQLFGDSGLNLLSAVPPRLIN